MDWDKEFVPQLLVSEWGDFLVPPIVLDESRRPFEGYEGVERFVKGGLDFIEEHVVKGATPADLPELARRMAELSEWFDVPIGFPDGRRAREGERPGWPPWKFRDTDVAR